MITFQDVPVGATFRFIVGGQVCAPIFRKISDQDYVYGYDVDRIDSFFGLYHWQVELSENP
jgi:hypothetical protein